MDKLIPKIKSDVQFNGERLDLDWLKPYVSQVGNEFTERYEKIKKLYDELMDEVYWNKLLYSLDTKFKPVIGHTYHLYKKDEKLFLSLICPTEWKMEFVSSFVFEHNGKWIKIK
jgi:hypothetical protein